ncbi:hypothetical protein [uncultured Enterovirga sp.]|uniref:hypothetical protein n=1 Tax=uncultured Enterovirga sp. TaxID=2026352 RepID=UPI0035CAD4DE
MNHGRLRAFALALALASGHPAWAACLAPTPPDTAARPAKPTLPARGPCVDAKPGTAGCLGWESYKYNDDVKAYNEQVRAFQIAANAYVAKLNDYVNAGAQYARCEVEALK